jgi:hypothetical protein
MSSTTKHISVTPTAKSVPFDNVGTDFVSTNVQDALVEVGVSASPGQSFGRTGVSAGGTFLLNETVPSNISGRWVYINSATVTKVFVSNELSTTYTLEAMYHDGNGVGLTSLGFVTVTAARGASITVSWPVPTNKQIAIRVANTTANSPKNIVCGLQLQGSA